MILHVLNIASYFKMEIDGLPKIKVPFTFYIVSMNQESFNNGYLNLV